MLDSLVLQRDEECRNGARIVFCTATVGQGGKQRDAQQATAKRRRTWRGVTLPSTLMSGRALE